MKILDRFLGPPLTSLVSKLRPVPANFELPRNLNRMLVIRPGGIGDATLLLPAVRALRGAYPESVIDILAERRNGGVFSLSSDVNTVFRYDRPTEFLSVLSRRYDLVIDTEQSHLLSAVVGRFSRAPLVIGYATNLRRRLFHRHIAYDDGVYEAECFFDLLAPLGVVKPVNIEAPFLSLPMTSVSRAAELLSTLRGSEFVAIFPGGSIPEKRWGPDRFNVLTRQINQAGYPVVIVGGGAERTDGEAIVAGAYGLNLAGQTTLAETAAIVDRSILLVSGDSGILHIAAGLGRPTVSLFGASSVTKWAPRGRQHATISKDLPCAPCTRFGYAPRCPRSAECITLISVEEVASAIFAVLPRTENIHFATCLESSGTALIVKRHQKERKSALTRHQPWP